MFAVQPAAAESELNRDAWRADGNGFEQAVDPADAFFGQRLDTIALDKSGSLDQVYQLSHLVPVGAGG